MCSVNCAFRLQFHAPFIPVSFVVSTTGSACLNDAVGYLLITAAERGETATKIDEAVNIVKDIAGDQACLLLIPSQVETSLQSY